MLSAHSLPAKKQLIACLISLLFISSLSAKPFTGTIEAIDIETRTLTLKSDSDEKSIQAGVGSGDIAIAKPGRRISGELIPQGKSLRLEHIFPADPEKTAILAQMSANLKQDTLRRGNRVFRSVGERIPDFALWDQNGNLFLSESLRGKYWIVNFVFTRCTMAEMCSAATSRMIELDHLLDAEKVDDVAFVSITLDPEYDTPGIWTAYAEDRGIDASRHFLLGGPPESVQFLKKQLGVLSESDPTQIIKHTMSTALVDPNGKIIYRLPGSRWDPQIFIKRIQRDRKK